MQENRTVNEKCSDVHAAQPVLAAIKLAYMNAGTELLYVDAQN